MDKVNRCIKIGRYTNTMLSQPSIGNISAPLMSLEASCFPSHSPIHPVQRDESVAYPVLGTGVHRGIRNTPALRKGTFASSRASRDTLDNY